MAATPLVTLTCNLDDLSGAAAGTTSNPARLRIALAGYGQIMPTVQGTAMIAKVGPYDVLSSGGPVTVQLWANDQINPTGTYYSISVVDGNGNTVQSGIYIFPAGGNPLGVDLSSYTQVADPGGPVGPLGPAGPPGPPATMAAGTATVLPAGNQPTVSVTGLNPYLINVGIPAGPTGPQGIQGPTGAAGTPPTFMGTWSSATTYAYNQAVYHAATNAVWVSAQNGNLNNTPAAGIWWTQLYTAPTLASTVSPAATIAGAVGTGTASTRNDHQHISEVYGQNIAPANVASTGMVTDTELVTVRQPNRLNLQWGVIDSNGLVALGVLTTGQVIGPTLLPPGSTLIGSDLTLPGNLNLPNGLVTDGEIIAISPNNYLGLAFAICDSTLKVSWGITKAGLVVNYGAAAATPTSTGSTAQLNQTGNPLAPNVDSLTFYSALDASSITQIYALADVWASVYNSTSGNNYATLSSAPAAMQLTSGSTNNTSQPHPNQDQSWVRFLRTPVAGGSPTVWKMNRWGQHQLAASSAYEALYALNHVLISGQSLSVGVTGTPILTATQPFSNLMFNGGVVPQNGTTTSATFPTPTSLVPLIEQVNTAQSGETIASAFANTLTQWMMEAGIQIPFLMSDWGVGGTVYSGLAKGTQPYTNGQAHISQAMSLATAAGFASYAVRALLWIHGEGDQNNASYDANLATMQANFETDSRALTGQAVNIPMFVCQQSGAMDNGGGITPQTQFSPYLQWQAAINNPGKIICTGPSYMCLYNNVHMQNIGYRKQAGYFAKAYLKTVIQNLPWRPLSPRKITRDGVNIYVDFWVPAPPIRINVQDVVQPGWTGSKYGFEWWDSSGTPPAITSVTVVGPTTLQIVLASVPTGSSKQLRYAYSFVAGQIPGPTTGQRGNLCDSDTQTNFYGDALPNWCVHFNLATN